MAHTRKKDGERKDKKQERMHEAVKERKVEADHKTTTDKGDIINYKPGSAEDSNRQSGP